MGGWVGGGRGGSVRSCYAAHRTYIDITDTVNAIYSAAIYSAAIALDKSYMGAVRSVE
jgi:hypothetical protein